MSLVCSLICRKAVFFGGLSIEEQINILNILPFAIGKLPMRYLGVPLITKKISAVDCKPLIEKVRKTKVCPMLVECN